MIACQQGVKIVMMWAVSQANDTEEYHNVEVKDVGDAQCET